MVPGTQEKYNFPKLSFVRGVTGKNDLGLKGGCCHDVSELRGHIGFEFKRLNLQAASWGPGSRVSGFLELGEGVGGSQGTWCSLSRSSRRGGCVLSGTIISPVGSLVIGIICSPDFFSDKLIPCQGKAV